MFKYRDLMGILTITSEMLLNAMHECVLRDLNSFYKHKSVNMRASTFNDLIFTLDHFLARPQGKNLTIVDTKFITEGAQSEHLPVHLIRKVRAKRCA
jgi:hypothetical protein